MNETQKRNFLRDIGQTLKPTWPFANEGEKLFAQFLDRNAYPYIYADQDLETYSARFYHEVSRPDFQIYIAEIGAAFWVDTKYKTVYKAAERRIVPKLLSKNFDYAHSDARHLVGNAPSSIRLGYEKYFTLDRREYTRLLKFRNLSNSQVWVCFIDRHKDTKSGHFINIDEIWSISYGEDEPRPDKHVRCYTARDPIEIPTNWRYLTKEVDFDSETSLSKLFERTEGELKRHREWRNRG